MMNIIGAILGIAYVLGACYTWTRMKIMGLEDLPFVIWWAFGMLWPAGLVMLHRASREVSR